MRSVILILACVFVLCAVSSAEATHGRGRLSRAEIRELERLRDLERLRARRRADFRHDGSEIRVFPFFRFRF